MVIQCFKDCRRLVYLVSLKFNCFWHFMDADNVRYTKQTQTHWVDAQFGLCLKCFSIQENICNNQIRYSLINTRDVVSASWFPSCWKFQHIPGFKVKNIFQNFILFCIYKPVSFTCRFVSFVYIMKNEQIPLK